MDKRRNGFAQRFGYWSTKMKMPDAGQGAWCAFWLASASGIPNGGTKGYEIDIVEAYGGPFKEDPGGDKYNWVVHPWNADGSQAPQPYEGGEWEDVPGGDAINNWHIYDCKVAPDSAAPWEHSSPAAFPFFRLSTSLEKPPETRWSPMRS